MPLDTAAKRRSAAGVPFLPLGPGVTPDAAGPVAWRQQAGWGYSGIAAAEANPPVFASRDVWGRRDSAPSARGRRDNAAAAWGRRDSTPAAEGGL